MCAQPAVVDALSLETNELLISNVYATRSPDGRDQVTFHLLDDRGREETFATKYHNLPLKVRNALTKLRGTKLVRPEVPFKIRKGLGHPTASVRTLTPYDCLYLLQFNFCPPEESDSGRKVNRQEKAERVVRYAQDMRRNEWPVTPHGIGIDDEGAFIDGQHRATSSVVGNVPFETVVVEGLKPESRFKVDLGLSRKSADIWDLKYGDLNLPGRYVNEIMSKVYLAHQGRGNLFTSEIMDKMGNFYRDSLIWFYQKAIKSRAAGADIFTKVPVSVRATFVMVHKVHPEEAETFLNALVNLRLDDAAAARATYEYLVKLSNGSGRASMHDYKETMYCILRGFQAFLRDDNITILKLAEGMDDAKVRMAKFREMVASFSKVSPLMPDTVTDTIKAIVVREDDYEDAHEYEVPNSKKLARTKAPRARRAPRR